MSRSTPDSGYVGRRLLKRLSYFWLPGLCLLCKMDSGRNLDLCAVCERDLPLLGHHCKICAAPLPTISTTPDTPATSTTPTTSTTARCGECLQRPPAFSETLTPYLYQAPLNRLVWRFKFNGDLAVGRVLANLLAQHLGELGNEMPDLIVPVPLHWRRKLARGFNQSGELAIIVGKLLDIPVRNDLLTRVTHTSPQRGLDRDQRRRNVKHAFAPKTIRAQRQIKDRSIAIVDDVVTTASTADAVARSLMHNGAAQVQVWAVARTLLEN